MICRRFFISGHVQGVCFRAYARSEAIAKGITGWAKNLPDGRVEVLACGEKQALDSLEQWLWQGSPHSKVNNVTSMEESEERGLTSFKVVD